MYLAKEYDFADIVGVDYSLPGVELARKVVQKHEETQENAKIEMFDMTDLEALYTRITAGETIKYDVLFDKGTFDAICLNADKTMRARYVATVVALMRETSYFVITSCNWTQEELLQMFEPTSTRDARAIEHEKLANLQPNAQLKQFKVLKHPEFSFGGKSGSTVATVAFKLM